jgi:KaiC/GvpD/RAD55 family RecA-like ATPase
MIERVPTGVPGFDQLIDGGFPRGSTVLLTGKPGTGKSMFALQYLYNGVKLGENGVYVYAESHVETLKEQAKQMGIDLEQLEKEGKIVLLNVPLAKKKFNILYAIEEAKDKVNAKRVVFDSLASFTVNIDLFTIPYAYSGIAASSVTVNVNADPLFRDLDEKEGRPTSSENSKQIHYKSSKPDRLIYLIIETLRNLGTTNLLITFSSDNGKRISTDGISEFISDGIIEAYNELLGAKHARTLSILKMRVTNHSQYIHEFEINDNGITVKPAEELYK